MLKVFKEYPLLAKQLSPLINLKNLPGNIRISTVTITCNLDTDFYYSNIGKYIKILPVSILSVKYQDDPSCMRSILPQKKKRVRKKKKRNRVFFNQVTLVVRSTPTKNINIKLFKNGSIQMTGCRNIQDFMNVMTVLCDELKIKMGIIDPKTLKAIIPKPFVSHYENVHISKIRNFSIKMINCDFNIGIKIDREKFYDLLIKQGVDCAYEPNKHAAINIKYKYIYEYKEDIPINKDAIENKKGTVKKTGINKITILVFESGAIIITAAKKKDHIVKAYNFIVDKITSNQNEIIKPDIDAVKACIQEVLQDIDIAKLQGIERVN